MQIVGWADLKEPVCESPYKFMCSNFINQYKEHELYLINKGEWSSSAHFEYEGEVLIWNIKFFYLTFAFYYKRHQRRQCIYLKTAESSESKFDSADDKENLYKLYEHKIRGENCREFASTEDNSWNCTWVYRNIFSHSVVLQELDLKLMTQFDK